MYFVSVFQKHHLLIMEELGGNKNFLDRFIAQHAAFFYYWIVVFIYIVNPTLAYNLNEVCYLGMYILLRSDQIHNIFLTSIGRF